MMLLNVVVKTVLILAVVLCMAVPFLIECHRFSRDKERKISYKRLRVVIYTGIYIVAVTVAMYFLKEVLLWLEGTSFIQWIVKKAAISDRASYLGKLTVAVIVNVAIGALYVFLGGFVRIGLKKKSLDVPRDPEKGFTRGQEFERKVILFFHKESWFFVARILKHLTILLAVMYAAIFVTYWIPAVFDAKWIPYEFISMLFGAGYVYPTITLLGLMEAYFFLAGIERLEDECPPLAEADPDALHSPEVDLQEIDEAMREQYKQYFVCDVDVSVAVQQDISYANHSKVTKFIAQAVANDKRNPKVAREIYLDCLDKLVESEKSLLINGNFFSEFSMYYLRYLSVVVSRGDTVLFICNSDSQINSVYEYLAQGMAELASIYCPKTHGETVDYDDPIWRIAKVSGEHGDVRDATSDEGQILVTSLSYVCSARFEERHKEFASMVDSVVLVDALNTVNKYNRQLSILNTRLKHIAHVQAQTIRNTQALAEGMKKLRYLSRHIRYVCFDDSRVAGLDKVLKNKLEVDFDTADIMRYSPLTLVRCYNYEGRANEEGRVRASQYVRTEERLSQVLDMAIFCLSKKVSNVTIYSDDVIPYAGFLETLKSNQGQLTATIDANRLHINKQYYNPNEYSVIIVMNSRANLPATLRSCASLAPDKPTLIVVLSQPYMLRNYYVGCINDIWSSNQFERIPVVEGTLKDIAQKILIKAGTGGITQKEILYLAADVPQLSEYAQNENVNAILRAVLDVYGESARGLDLFNYFEYASTHDFNENGVFSPEDRVFLRRGGNLFESINGRDMAVMVAGGKEIILPLPRNRITQNYIAGQNLIHNGDVYRIQKIDAERGRIYAHLAVGGHNTESYRYVQAREYRVVMDAEQMERVFPAKMVHLATELGDVCVNDVRIDVLRLPMEVVTKSYYEIKSDTLNVYDSKKRDINEPGNDELAKQTYRRYGRIDHPFYTSGKLFGSSSHMNSKDRGALVMTLRLTGRFGPDCNKTMALAAVMLNELLHTMFPSVADSVVVCPRFSGELTDEDVGRALAMLPTLTVDGDVEPAEKDVFELYIIEDCTTDLGVVSVLMSSGSDVLRTLFTPIWKYLQWHASEGDSTTYLHAGLDHEPTCFDFASLKQLVEQICDNKHDMVFADIESVIEYEVCDFCGKRHLKCEEVVDGRKMCHECAENIVGNNKKILKAHLDRARMFLESTYGIELDDDYEFCFESTVKIANTLRQNRRLRRRDADIPVRSYIDDRKKVHAEYSIPSINLSELLIRDLTHTWQLRHTPALAEDLSSGHMALVVTQYLKFLGQHSLAAVRANHLESANTAAGEGYRKLVHALLVHPQFRNNPFRYLLDPKDDDGQSETGEGGTLPPVPGEVGACGLPYAVDEPDRAKAGEMPYLYRERLSTNCRAAYDAMVEAIQRHEPQITVSGCSFEELCDVSTTIRFDHPELFWYKKLSMTGDRVDLIYGATESERAELQVRIDEVVAKYLEGIDDSMSAYDVAVRLHAKLIASVDYDTIALNRTKKNDAESNGIDYLRTICGVFLNGKAVCEGYARAMQYLLHKCGIECAEVAGNTFEEDGSAGEAHAWNILKIDGEYYYMDVTWDDSSDTIQTVKETDMGFNYFCVTTEELFRTRRIDLTPVEPPLCTATAANYYTHNNLVLNTYSMERIKAIAADAAAKGQTFFTIKLSTAELYEETLRRLFVEGDEFAEAVREAAKVDKKIATGSCRYSHNKPIRTITVRFKYK